MILENIKMAIESIKSNKMRSFLTMLGIIIGISSVIMIVSAGDGAKQFIMGQFEEAGTTMVLVTVDSQKSLDADHITLEDVEALTERIPHAKAVSPLEQTFGQIVFKGKEQDMMMAGCLPSGKELGGVKIIKGRFFTDNESDTAANVVVIDDITAKKFFGSTDVIGMSIDVFIQGNRSKARIVGVMENEYGDFYFEGMPGTVYMPLNTMIAVNDWDTTFNSVYLMAESKEHTQTVGNQAVNILEARHSNRGRDIYRAENMLKQMDTINSTIGLIQTFVAAVAAISLLVGGIGVMNIMLVAVTERTREIGIRKSLGAKTGAILFQFLTESAILTLIGGIIGLMFGYLGSLAICQIAGITPVFNPSTIATTVIFSATVGIFFGIYPARKAARLNPIDALRHE